MRENGEWPARFLVRGYRALRRVLPRGFRETHASEMAEVVDERIRDTLERRGRAAAVWQGAMEMLNLLMAGGGLRLERVREWARRHRLGRRLAGLALLFLLFVALDDITTGRGEGFALEWVAVVSTSIALLALRVTGPATRHRERQP